MNPCRWMYFVNIKIKGGCHEGPEGSRTEKNILTAFAGESQARNRYTYSRVRRKRRYVQISMIFEETANQEKNMRNVLQVARSGEVEITATFPSGVIGSTVANLDEAAGGERYENSGCTRDSP